MKSIIIFTFILCSFFGQAQTNEVLNIGMPGQEIYGIDSYQDSIGNVYYCGNLTTNNNQGLFLVSKFNSNYEIQWAKSVGHVTGAGPAVLMPHPEGGVLAKMQDYALGYKSLIVRISDSGSIIWSKMLNSNYSIANILVLKNGDILINYGFGKLSLLDANGVVLWAKVFSHTSNAVAVRNCIETLDGNLMLFTTVVNSSGVPILSLVKIDMFGNEIFKKHYVVSNVNLSLQGVLQSSDSSYFFIANDPTFGITDRDVVVRKFNKDGNYIIGKSYGGDYLDYAHDIIEGETGLIHISLTVKPVQICGGNSALISLNPNTLDTLQTRTYGTTQGNGSNITNLHRQGSQIYSASWGSLFTQIGTVDGHFLRTDETFDLPCLSYSQPLEVTNLSNYVDSNVTINLSNDSPPLLIDTVFITNVDSLLIADACTGNYLSTNEAHAEIPIDEVYVYPNPAINTLSLSKSFEEVRIYDFSGRVVKSVYNTNFIDIKELNRGVYYLIGFANGQKKCTKFVKI